MSILKRYFRKHDIVLRKGDSVHIILSLVWNEVLLLRLRLFKWVRGIHRPIVHYYAVCWNEEKILPFVFDYYGRFVDKFVIYDNYSSDGSESIIANHRKAELYKFESNGFNDIVQNKIKNSCWKKSRGHADLVVVCDIDEFLYHTDINHFFKCIIDNCISCPAVKGYNMYSTHFPIKGRLITEQIKTGVTDCAYSKCILFDPHRIVDIGYTPGGHQAHPTGVVRQGNGTAKLLHYKNLGLEYLIQRYKMLSMRLSETNKQEGLGMHYMYPIAQVKREFQEGMSASVNLLPKLSIIMPTLNSEATLSRALSSIQQQSFVDWEVVIMDGGSTDNTLDIVNGFDEPRFKVFKGKDIGIYDAMNHGIIRSQGEWLYFIGCDDYLLESTVLEKVFSRQLNADMVYCDVQSTYLSSDYLGKWNFEKLKCNRSHQGIFYRRHIFDTIGLYPLQYKVCADHYMNLRVFLNPALISEYLPIEVAFHTHGGYSATAQDFLFEKDVDNIIAFYGKGILPKPLLKNYCVNALKHHRTLSQKAWLYGTMMKCCVKKS